MIALPGYFFDGKCHLQSLGLGNIVCPEAEMSVFHISASVEFWLMGQPEY